MAAREYKFNFVMTVDEKRRLQVLANAESRTNGGWLRAMIKREYDTKVRGKHAEMNERSYTLRGDKP